MPAATPAQAAREAASFRNFARNRSRLWITVETKWSRFCRSPSTYVSTPPTVYSRPATANEVESCITIFGYLLQTHEAIRPCGSGIAPRHAIDLQEVEDSRGVPDVAAFRLTWP